MPSEAEGIQAPISTTPLNLWRGLCAAAIIDLVTATTYIGTSVAAGQHLEAEAKGQGFVVL